jgi:hypothetical protein
MAEYDWSELNGTVVDRLRAPKTVPVPRAIIEQAQRSVDGDPDKLEGTLAIQATFDAPKAEVLAKLMAKAGAHTSPPCSMRVVTGILDENGELVKVPDGMVPATLTVAWKAGKRRGKPVA